MEKPREESQILEDLAALAASAGYVHAVAHICHRDNVIHIQGKLKPSDMDQLFSRERLIRTELTTVIGLMAKKPLDLSLQPPEVLAGYVKRTDDLMHELHEAMTNGRLIACTCSLRLTTRLTSTSVPTSSS